MDYPLIAVSAVEHPVLDDWVRRVAEEEARRNGGTLGEYVGREDVLGPDRDPGLCCHLFGVLAGPVRVW
jgi:hypothetical protein